MSSESFVSVEEDVQIYYEVHRNFGEGCSTSGKSVLERIPQLHLRRGAFCGRHDCSCPPKLLSVEDDKPVRRIVFIMGLAASCAAWREQVYELLGSEDQSVPTEILLLDNRGIGKSSCPEDKRRYSIERMALDTFRVMDHLGWKQASLVGHSMGGFIALKMALAQPKRILSAVVISSSMGGISTVTWKGFKTIFKVAKAKTIEQRTAVDLLCHFSEAYLEGSYEGSPRRAALTERYNQMKREAEDGGASKLKAEAGVKGQSRACMKYSLSRSEARRLRAAGVPIHVMHGSNDIIAKWEAGLKLARAVRAETFLLVDSGHFTPFERAAEVNMAIRQFSWHPLEA